MLGPVGAAGWSLPARTEEPFPAQGPSCGSPATSFPLKKKKNARRDIIALEVSVRAQVFEIRRCEEADGTTARVVFPLEAELNADE